jgi:beta-glucosidase
MTTVDDLGLPHDFLLGVATASYQVEGAVDEGGRGPSSWDVFSHAAGRTLGGDTGDVACDHYRRYPEDIALMKELGVDAYRFSFAWPRIQPNGKGSANRAGLDFYDRVVDGLLAAGIQPSPTLFHWDTPLALEQQGGWLNADTAKRFADYAHILGEHFADRVARWITINEPAVLTMQGYGTGVHAPGLRLGLGAVPAGHHLLLAHGLAVEALRESGADNIGIANSHTPVWPASDRDEDQAAAALYDNLSNRLFTDPLLLGSYPSELEQYLPDGFGDHLRQISAPLDWYGINYYMPTSVGAAARVPKEEATDADLPFARKEIRGYPLTDFGWPVVPKAFTELLVSFKQRYGDALPPIYITENGCAINDGPDAAGAVSDTRRTSFTEGHLAAIGEAIASGVDVRGYFHWSLLDNFEWAAGYSQRFGLVHVDFDTQKRTPKESYYWYRNLIRSSR